MLLVPVIVSVVHIFVRIVIKENVEVQKCILTLIRLFQAINTYFGVYFEVLFRVD